MVGGSQQGRVAAAQLGAIGPIDFADQRGGGRDGVDPQVGLGTVDRASLALHPPANASLVRGDQAQVGRLADKDRLRIDPLGQQGLGPGKLELLDHGQGHLDRARRRSRGGGPGSQRSNPGHLGLGVGGSPAPQASGAGGCREGLNLHPGDRNRIHGGFEQGRRHVGLAFQPDPQVGPTRQCVAKARLEPRAP